MKRVVLFGSRSRGDFYSHSDIDLLLVSDEFPDDWFKRPAQLYFLKLKQIEPIGYTTAEIHRMIEKGNNFVENVFFASFPAAVRISAIISTLPLRSVTPLFKLAFSLSLKGWIDGTNIKIKEKKSGETKAVAIKGYA